jgi:hypothetical protein
MEDAPLTNLVVGSILILFSVAVVVDLLPATIGLLATAVILAGLLLITSE